MKNSVLLSGLFFGVLFLSRTDSHAQWQPDVRLTNDPAASFTSLNNAWCIASSSPPQADVHVVWYDFRDGNWEIYYKRSTDGGVSWGSDTRLTNFSFPSLNPSVSVSGSTVHVVWQDNRDGNIEIYYKRSTDGGTSWGTDSRLTNNSFASTNPSVSVSGTVVHVVWRDDRDVNFCIYYKRSTDGGIGWGADTRLSSNNTISGNPSVSVSGSVVHVVWQDDRNGPTNYEIYYKRDPTGNPTGVDITNSEIPGEFELHQNYPNPFNPNTKITFSLPRSELVTLRVFNTFGELVATLVSVTVSAGTHQLEWNAEGLPSGVYFYHLQAGALNQTRKLILLK